MNLLDLIEREEEKDPIPKPVVKPEDCKKHDWKNGLYIWPGETWERLVKTCKLCGEMRGRCK